MTAFNVQIHSDENDNCWLTVDGSDLGKHEMSRAAANKLAAALRSKPAFLVVTLPDTQHRVIALYDPINLDRQIEVHRLDGGDLESMTGTDSAFVLDQVGEAIMKHQGINLDAILDHAKPLKHIRATHPSEQECGPYGCNLCNLFLCSVCGGAEGSLATECPGYRVPTVMNDLVYAGAIDFVAGRWVTKDDRVEIDIKRRK